MHRLEPLGANRSELVLLPPLGTWRAIFGLRISAFQVIMVLLCSFQMSRQRPIAAPFP